MESWNSKDTKNGSSLDYEDAKDLPIELRRLEDFEDFPEPPLSAGLKSRSLGSILNPPPRQIVRSRSSVPSLGAQIPEKNNVTPPVTESRRPKLVKQKQSLCDDEFVMPNENGFSHTQAKEKKLFLRKQSSLNEELMAENRIREKERVRKRIQKQMSLNEAFLCRSIFSKRLQVIREGFTTKLKTSTGSLERVTKCGLVKIMQNFKGSQNSPPEGSTNVNTVTPSETNASATPKDLTSSNSKQYLITNNCCGNGNIHSNNCTTEEQKARRHSRESGSGKSHIISFFLFPSRFVTLIAFFPDSSKDSLQSDTSIESEDSFASVIYVPRQDQQIHQLNNELNSNNIRTPSVPTSPLVMPCPTPAHSPAPPRCKLQALMPEQTRFTFEEEQIQKSDDTPSVDTNARTYTSSFFIAPTNSVNALKSTVELSSQKPLINTIEATSNRSSCTSITTSTANTKISSSQKSTTTTTTTSSSTNKSTASPKSTTSSKSTSSSKSSPKSSPKFEKITKQIVKNLPPIPKFKKPSNFPIVRRATTAPVVPKLTSMEIFNPETDDLDSDSSEPSSPDSIDSVISALKPITTSTTTQSSLEAPPLVEITTSGDEDTIEFIKFNHGTVVLPNDVNNTNNISSYTTDSKVSKNHYHILGNDDEYDKCACKHGKNGDNVHNECHINPFVSRQHLVDFAEKLSAQLLKELDENHSSDDNNSTNNEKTKENSTNSNNNKNSNSNLSDIINERNSTIFSLDDPYIKKLNGEIRDLNSLREELRERRLMLANLNIHQYQNNSTSSTIHEEDESPIKNDHDGDDEEDDSEDEDRDNENCIDPNTSTDNNYDMSALLIDDDNDEDPEDHFHNILHNCHNNHHDHLNNRINSPNHEFCQDDIASIINSNDNLSISISRQDDHHTTTTTHQHQVPANRHNSHTNDQNSSPTTRSTMNTSCSSLSTIGVASTSNATPKTNKSNKLLQQQQRSSAQSLESRQSIDSWAHSNSTASLDSPSVGGSSTHHRYYHVFREGELDALINHHVASLHIVSSYYERASWCVVAEKVQVWTI